MVFMCKAFSCDSQGSCPLANLQKRLVHRHQLPRRRRPAQVADARCPWGDTTPDGNNSYTDCPGTGITRTYDWNITRGTIGPDGYAKNVILINGEFPGLLVTNLIDEVDEGTAIHWHGFTQNGTPWVDGVPGVSHHYSAQYSGGLFGPIVVHGANNEDFDVDIGPILVNSDGGDHGSCGFTGRIFSNNLINGKMNLNCSTVEGDETPCTDNTGLAKFQFQSGKKHLLRLNNSGSGGVERTSIDGHNMTIIANDFRVDVVVTADAGKPNDAFWLRTNLTSCSSTIQPFARATVFYENADENSIPTSTAWNAPDPGTCANGDLSLTANDGNFTWDDIMNVHSFGGNSSVRIIVSNPTLAPHPIHALGVNMYILSQGSGDYDGTTIVNPENSKRRDVQMVIPKGHIVVQMETVNTGVWPFHCHVAWHASVRFFSQMVFNPDEIDSFDIPNSVQRSALTGTPLPTASLPIRSTRVCRRTTDL
ncbi:multicopper oxidase-domain-containing protein [Pseudomassariella vexata]|uniref:Multicopper oxidase-domain-containing protein n=1 Tax=Pseudomassariella vexata TaxID=1141098 RepID=A0A1Y2DN42_9PEZI|nr:multicopper oxidase-domain-containing protein [Pseudomassariella vexata]ORY60692.1 multicopper oxidase-domain-containing protein [Pseudomassariella vexata]